MAISGEILVYMEASEDLIKVATRKKVYKYLELC